LSCRLGRHAWTVRVNQGESYKVCAACGKTPRRGGKPPLSQTDLDYMKAGGPAGTFDDWT
jgi:hypothetical protein